eukprot:TRINITY_DN34723_c0_g1_i1.p4 TRINITY_DN34723_c0_g1~~TRINITY_DN34723_c0_g1_i1.p4  ORF type:complete len:125 (+),score=1.96 TRINITY_DN34723_c0_g1_i1:1112-1486(+)
MTQPTAMPGTTTACGVLAPSFVSSTGALAVSNSAFTGNATSPEIFTQYVQCGLYCCVAWDIPAGVFFCAVALYLQPGVVILWTGAVVLCAAAFVCGAAIACAVRPQDNISKEYTFNELFISVIS